MNTSYIKLASTVLTNYLEILKNYGYIKNTLYTDALLIIFLSEFLNGSMSFFITDEDYKKISKIINSMMGSCMIPFESYISDDPWGTIVGKVVPRLTEFNDLRFTENDNLRLVNL